MPTPSPERVGKTNYQVPLGLLGFIDFCLFAPFKAASRVDVQCGISTRDIQRGNAVAVTCWGL